MWAQNAVSKSGKFYLVGSLYAFSIQNKMSLFHTKRTKKFIVQLVLERCKKLPNKVRNAKKCRN